MTTTITISGTEVSYRDFSITVPTSPMDIAPSAEVTTNATESISANDPLEVAIDGTTVFAGYTRSGGTISDLGGVEVTAAHGARDVFEDTVSLSLASPTDEQVLSAALSAAGGGTSLTLSYAGTATSLNNDYDCTDRPVKRVFRDMMDRTGRVWWVDPAGTTVNVEPLGGRGTWQAIDTQADRATLQRFDTGNVDTVRNAVTVVGTGEEQVRATVEDTTSISTYGRRPGNSPYNVAYITTQSEAAAVADELIIAEPQPEGTLLAGTNVGDITQPLANYEVDITDQGKNLDIDNLVIESQTIEQGQATLSLGAGVGVSIEEINRSTKSQEDQNEPGSVYNSDRLADNSIDTPQLVDASVIEQKLQDAAVATAKLENNAVINGKLDDLSVSETKIQDNSISTPKLVAEAVTANKIEADTITAAEIAAGTITALEIAADTITAEEIVARTITALEIAADAITANEIDAGTITATEIASDTLTADQIDTLNLDTGELTISDFGTDPSLNFDIHSYSLNDALAIAPSGQVTMGVVGDRIEAINSVFIDSTNAQFDGGTSTLMSFEQDPNGVDPVLRPLPAGEALIGTATYYFHEMNSEAFNIQSPDPIESVDRDEVREADWYDNQPSPVKREQRRQKEERREKAEKADAVETHPDDENRDHDPVELGTVANWLMEVCKDQQKQIDELERRVETLEN